MYKKIKNFENYLITDTGEVISTLYNKKRVLKQNKNYKGYKMVRLGRKKYAAVHRIVAQAFIPNPNNLPQVNHIDENKENNRVDNLEWVTAKENINYGNHNINMARTLRKNSGDILCYKDGEVKKFTTIAEAARVLKLDDGNISRVIRGNRKSVGGYKFKYAV